MQHRIATRVPTRDRDHHLPLRTRGVTSLLVVVVDYTIVVVATAPLTLRFTLTYSGSLVPFTRHPCYLPLPSPVAPFDLHLLLVDLQPTCSNRSSIAAATMNGDHVSFSLSFSGARPSLSSMPLKARGFRASQSFRCAGHVKRAPLGHVSTFGYQVSSRLNFYTNDVVVVNVSKVRKVK